MSTRSISDIARSLDPQSHGRLGEVNDALKKMMDGQHLGKYVGKLVNENVALLGEAWSSLDSQVQEAVLEKVEKALREIEVGIDPSTGLNARQKLKRLIPTVYDLIKVAQSHFPEGQAWTTRIDRDVFDQALLEVRKAANCAWRSRPEDSDIYRVWNWIHPSAQLEMLGYTQRCCDVIKQQQETKEQNNGKRSDAFSYPRLERYEELSGLSHDQMRELIAHHHLGTTESNRRSNDMPPPPIPSQARPAGSTSTAPHQFQAQARRSTDESSDGPHPIVEGAPSLFHNGRVVAVDHWGPSTNGSTRATRYPSRGTEQNPFNIN